MDLIDKIHELQYYYALPFGKIFEDSLYFKSVSNFHTHKNGLLNKFTMSYNNIEEISPEEEYYFSFQINNNILQVFDEHKYNIIIKDRDKYILLKDINSLSFDRTNQYNSTRYNYYSQSLLKYTNDKIIISGIAKSIIVKSNKNII